MNNDKRNDEPAQDQDAELKRLLAKLGIHSDENVYLSIESMEAVTAAVTDEEKRQLIARSLQFRNPPQSRSYFIKIPYPLTFRATDCICPVSVSRQSRPLTQTKKSVSLHRVCCKCSTTPILSLPCDTFPINLFRVTTS